MIVVLLENAKAQSQRVIILHPKVLIVVLKINDK